MKKFFCIFLSAMLFVCLYTACGASSAVSGQAAEEAPMAAERNDALAAQNSAGATALPENRKWVITSEVRAETEDLDTLLASVLEKISGLEGYVENQNLYNGSGPYDSRTVRLTARIPAQHVDEFLTVLKEQANVVSSSKNLEDITLQYVDTETRMKALKTEESRLLELMEQAENMSDLLEIEQRLTEVRYEIEAVTSRLRTYDNQVNYATVHLTIEEVREFTPVEEPGFLERITTGFKKSLRGVGEGFVDFVVLIIVGLPYIVVWLAVGLIIWLIVRTCKKHRKPRKPNIPPQYRPVGNHFDPMTGKPLDPPAPKPQDPPEK